MGPFLSDGEAKALGAVMYVGLASCTIAAVLTPPGMLTFCYWLAQPRIGLTLSPKYVFWGTLGLWGGALLTLYLYDCIVERLREEKRRREHAEFQSLRPLFYKSNEVCLETLDELRARTKELTNAG